MSPLEKEYLRMRRAISECNDSVQKAELIIRKIELRREIFCYYATPQREKPSQGRMVLRNIIACARAAGRAFRSASRRPAFAGASQSGESEDGDGDSSDPPERRPYNLSASISQFLKLKLHSDVSRRFVGCCDVPFPWGYYQ